ncbi:hypothetical protein ER308_05820 [Egibacter rhizosphaerae]|uniref:Mannose-6-phosphate isomerase n=1 Tax=Egibacter rhizosphaerae TaxID=1670831 RepID=A0A411YD39_9ACTN|nr:hypothetical protein [Egibacter rhizosphaerae]QBI19105.1 hypothetical protein ER308_05820 [Egibacter rhizosphaerae]
MTAGSPTPLRLGARTLHEEEHGPSASPTALVDLSPDGTVTRELAADPVGWLGKAHWQRYGADPALRVTLRSGPTVGLHAHPDRRVARAHFDSAWGATATWLVLGIDHAGAQVRLGFAEDLDAGRLADTIASPREQGLLEATNAVPVTPGDGLLVPAGVPHAAGPDVHVLTVHEPGETTVPLDGTWADGSGGGTAASARGNTADLDPIAAAACVDRSAWSPARLRSVHTTRRNARREGGGTRRALPPAADPFFTARWVTPDPLAWLPASFGLLVVLSGEGTLATQQGHEHPLSRGEAWLVPHTAGRVTVSGGLEGVHVAPPDSAAERPDAPAVERPLDLPGLDDPHGSG